MGVPHLKILSDEAYRDLLVNVEMPFCEFEAYYKHLQMMKEFDELVTYIDAAHIQPTDRKIKGR